jgi:hypothetical protein
LLASVGSNVLLGEKPPVDIDIGTTEALSASAWFPLPVYSSLSHPSADRLRLHDDSDFLISHDINGIIRIMHSQEVWTFLSSTTQREKLVALMVMITTHDTSLNTQDFFCFSLLLALQACGAHSR